MRNYVYLCDPVTIEPGDMNCGGAIDAGDIEMLAVCMNGPELPHQSPCGRVDLDGDADADLIDFALLQLGPEAVAP